MSLLPYDLGCCAPDQIITLDTPYSDIESVSVTNDCGTEYPSDNLTYSVSTDGSTWSCYMAYTDLIDIIYNTQSDFYLKIKVKGPVGTVAINGVTVSDYTTQLYSGFSFDFVCRTSSNMYNPYANMECAIGLQQSLVNLVSCMFGIPVYYFKVGGVAGAKDITFKEYALKEVESMKQIKLIVSDGAMPSSKPEFSDWGLDWQSDWETEIAKGAFATAFGTTAYPTEGDLVYIPMMKRMWMVNGAYDEKKDGIMWTSTTFKVSLVKYTIDESVDLGDSEAFIADCVKNTYTDLFGGVENVDAGVYQAIVQQPDASGKYPVYLSDHVRSVVAKDVLECESLQLYYKGTMLSQYVYRFLSNVTDAITYQKTYSGCDITISCILDLNSIGSDFILYNIIRWGNLGLYMSKSGSTITVSNALDTSVSFTTKGDGYDYYLLIYRYSSSLNVCDLNVYVYSYPSSLSLYKLQPHHMYFDIDNPVGSKVSRYNVDEMLSVENASVSVSGRSDVGITNIKLFNFYNDNVSECMYEYGNNAHLIINDIAQPLAGQPGIVTR